MHSCLLEAFTVVSGAERFIVVVFDEIYQRRLRAIPSSDLKCSNKETGFESLRFGSNA